MSAEFAAETGDHAWTASAFQMAGPNMTFATYAAAMAVPACTWIALALPAEQMRGYLVRGTAMVRADGVSAKPNQWNGIKIMLAIETPDPQ